MENHIIMDQVKEKKKEYIGDKLDDFEILQTLGKGSYGFVAKVKSKINDKIYAMKMIDFSLIRDPIEKQLSLNEIKIIESFDSPHIIKYYNSFNIETKLYILMEYIDNGDIKGYISAHQNMNKAIPEEELWELFYQSMAGLCCIHKNNLIHRDIKPANLFLTNDKKIKIGDFGVSASREKSQNIVQTVYKKETMMIGTPLYMSPEMFRHEQYGSKVDVYALGCTFFEMCFFSPPRIPIPIMSPNLEISTDLQDIDIKHNKGKYSNELCQIIKTMIERDPKNRPSSANVFDMIKIEYNKRKRQNSSINAIIRCLFTLQKFTNSLLKHRADTETNKVTTKAFLFAYDNYNSNNWQGQLKYFRDCITFENSCFIDPGEIEPIDLIEYILKTLHIENNKIKNNYSRIFTKDEDPDIFNRVTMLNKYFEIFKNHLKSFISNLFFGTLEINKYCYTCNRKRFYFENFFYIVLDINQSIKCGNNPKSQDFIIQSLNTEFTNNFNTLTYCPNCKSQQNHCENKKIISIPYNLIICFKNDGPTNLNIPQNLDFSPVNLGTNGIYNLKGIIGKTIFQKHTFYSCIFPFNNNWVISDDLEIKPFQSFSDLNSLDIVMLFYSSVN